MSGVVVTGATSGIGKSICINLARRGWDVFAAGRTRAKSEILVQECRSSYISGLHALEMDVDNLDSIQRAISYVNEESTLDAWVNNAGISNISPFLHIQDGIFDKIMRTNVRGMFFAMQYAAQNMVDHAVRGSIVNIASMASKQGSVPLLADYVASKFAVLGATQAAAYELGKYGIRVNSVCPGFIETHMQESEELQESRLTGIPVDEIHRRFVEMTPLQRIGRSEDVAKTVSFLLSSDAEFITGESIAVNGGAYMD